jgi:raffinose/stachyose/melibiose transport system substrate-binding protein
VVSKGAPKQTPDFLKAFVSDEVQRKLTAAGFLVPVVKGADQSLSNAFMRHIAENLAGSTYHQNFYDQALGPSVGRTVNDVVAEMAGGTMTSEAAAKAVEAAWKQGN